MQGLKSCSSLDVNITLTKLSWYEAGRPVTMYEIDYVGCFALKTNPLGTNLVASRHPILLRFHRTSLVWLEACSARFQLQVRQLIGKGSPWLIHCVEVMINACGVLVEVNCHCGRFIFHLLGNLLCSLLLVGE
uniref:ScMYB75 protein n=1 Tax=Saccharum hybrid cultivar Co 86032 TaxID=672234 RepID=A0A0C6WCQ6_9POAL|nr:ScMYB75 protein [Saccharum hybrid cultivar Co 86032]